MKRILFLLVAVAQFATLGYSQTTTVTEASAAQVTAGTAGAGYYVSPRRLAGAPIPSDIQTQLDGKQPLDSDLTAYANAADATARRALIGAALGSVLPTSLENQQLVFVGTSITAGLTSPNTVSYPMALAQLPGFIGRGTFTNYGGYGGSLADLQSTYISQPYTKRPAATGSSRSVLFVEIGANDFRNTSLNVATWISGYNSYMATAKSDGFFLVAFTIMKRTPQSTGGYAIQEQNRYALNTAIRANTSWDILVDLDELFPNIDNTTFVLDGTHPNDLGNKRIANLVSNAVVSQGIRTSLNPASPTIYPVLPLASESVLERASLKCYSPAGYGAISPTTAGTGTGQATVEWWGKYAPISSGQVVYGTYGPTNMNLYVLGTSNQEGAIAFEGAAGASRAVAYADRWGHFVGTRDDSGNVTYYYNGVNVGTSTITTNWTSGLNQINHNNNTASIARVRVYNRKLSDAEVLGSFNRLSTLSEKDRFGSMTALTAGSFTVGRTYRIVTVGTTDYTLIGAIANTVGVEFTTTGAGTGTGTALPIGAIYAMDDCNRYPAGLSVSDLCGTASVLTATNRSAYTDPVVSPFLLAGIARIGTGVAGAAEFSDTANFSSGTNYSFLSVPAGDRYLNARTGKSIFLCVNNVVVGTITATGYSGTIATTPAGTNTESTVQATLTGIDARKAALATVQASTPTTGQTVSMTDNAVDNTLYITPAGTLAALSVNLPSNANSRIGQVVRVFTTQDITAITFANATTILNPPAALNTNESVTFQKMAANTWAVIVSP